MNADLYHIGVHEYQTFACSNLGVSNERARGLVTMCHVA